MGNKKRKEFEELEVTDDYMFKLVMRKYPRLCKTLVETVLNVDIKRLEYLETEKAIAPCMIAMEYDLTFISEMISKPFIL